MEEQQKTTQASILLAYAQDVRLFKAPTGEAYATLHLDGRSVTQKVKSSAMRHWLTLRYADDRTGAPSKTAIESVLAVLEARARFRSETKDVHVRLAWHENTMYLDLHAGMVVRVTAAGWDVLPATEAPILFYQPRGALPLPQPERGGTLDELRPFLNLPEDHERDWVLTVGWLLGALHPTGPYALLALHGEKGSAKSTTTRYLRQLVDPSIAPAPVQPRDGEDLTLKASHNWIVAFDNMSSMPRWLSDGLCRLSTGAGDSKRELYADSEEVIFMAKRPIIINGIEELATAGDLLDRAVIVTLPVIPPTKRQSDARLNADFEQARPLLLGAVLDAVVAALRNQDQVHLLEAPRMKDFAEWVVSAEMGGGLGWKEGTFMGAYHGNREDAQQLELDASPVATLVLHMMAEREKRGEDDWTGTATELHTLLKQDADEGTTRRNDWPKTGKVLSDRLRRDAGALRSAGVAVEWTKSGKRSITLHRITAGGMEDAVGAVDAPIHHLPVIPFSLKKEEIGKGHIRASSAPNNIKEETEWWWNEGAGGTTTTTLSDDEEEEVSYYPF